MNRRDMIKSGLLALVAISLPEITTATVWPHKGKRPLTISDIMQVSHSAVRNEMCQGGEWASRELRCLTTQGVLQTRPIGPQVDIDGKSYDVSQITIPMVWTQKDEKKANTEAKKIALATALIENAFLTHDDLILDRIGKGKAVASRQYRYDLGLTQHIPNANAYVIKLYTAIAFTDYQDLYVRGV